MTVYPTILFPVPGPGGPAEAGKVLTAVGDGTAEWAAGGGGGGGGSADCLSYLWVPATDMGAISGVGQQLQAIGFNPLSEFNTAAFTVKIPPAWATADITLLYSAGDTGDAVFEISGASLNPGQNVSSSLPILVAGTTIPAPVEDEILSPVTVLSGTPTLGGEYVAFVLRRLSLDPGDVNPGSIQVYGAVLTKASGADCGNGGGSSFMIQADSIAQQFFTVPESPDNYTLALPAFTQPAGFDSVLVEVTAYFTVENVSVGALQITGSLGLAVPDFDPPFNLDGIAPLGNEPVPAGESTAVHTITFDKVYAATMAEDIVIWLTLAIPGTSPTPGPTLGGDNTAAGITAKLTYFNAV